ncbi:Rossmann-fold NAD(P)-binding domain-containing protein [Micromonospora zhanjiangensis]|uniref:WD40-like Beta Propeller Repeat n=1 Tax=Micromonospora zhanjiangensis TaxID=1522057 RepID=A0ABV8KQC3_9ACTN
MDATVAGGVPPAGIDRDAHLSADGRYAGFSSSATDLVPGATNGVGQAYLRDLKGRTTELISVADDGGPGDGLSYVAGVSANGRYVLFVSHARSLLPGAPPPTLRNVYLRDRWQRSTRVVATVPPNSMAPGWSPHLSPDGRYSLVDLVPTRPIGETRWLSYLIDNIFGTDSQLLSVSVDGGWPNGSTYSFGSSFGGRFVLLSSDAGDLVPGDTNNANDVFVRDTVAGTTVRVSVG